MEDKNKESFIYKLVKTLEEISDNVEKKAQENGQDTSFDLSWLNDILDGKRVEEYKSRVKLFLYGNSFSAIINVVSLFIAGIVYTLHIGVFFIESSNPMKGLLFIPISGLIYLIITLSLKLIGKEKYYNFQMFYLSYIAIAIIISIRLTLPLYNQMLIYFGTEYSQYIILCSSGLVILAVIIASKISYNRRKDQSDMAIHDYSDKRSGENLFDTSKKRRDLEDYYKKHGL